MIREFGIGVRMLLSGFGFWRTRPKLMCLGLIPAIIAFLLLAAGMIPLFFVLDEVAGWLTPFANGWVSPWREILRGTVSTVVFVAALVLAGSVFSALALFIGEPIYQRIWQAVETQLGDAPTSDGSFWAAFVNGLRLTLFGMLIALLVLLIGFVPLVGGALGVLVGFPLTARMLARELTDRSFDGRDLSPEARKALLRGSRARVLGFGVATQLCFLIPLGAVATMPAAVVGATLLSRTMLERTPLAAASV